MLCMTNSTEAKNVVSRLMLDAIGVEPTKDMQAILWVSPETNAIEWIVGYTAFIGKTCQIHVVNINNAPYTPRKLIFAAFDYPFNYRGVEKLFGIVNSHNTKAMEYDQKLGFREVQRFAGMHDDGGDLVLFEMNKSDCRWIKGQKHERA